MKRNVYYQEIHIAQTILKIRPKKMQILDNFVRRCTVLIHKCIKLNDHFFGIIHKIAVKTYRFMVQNDSYLYAT